MSNFGVNTYHFDIHDDYYTKKWAWEQIIHLIPEHLKNGVCWECCLLNSNLQSKNYLQELGLNVVGDRDIDFLKTTLE